MIAGIGVDIVQISRIQNSLERFSRHFLERIFSAAELREAQNRKEQLSYYAGRWAAKEAFSKALGCGIGAQCAFSEIEITNDSAGKPQLRLSGNAAQTAALSGGGSFHVSISHEQQYAVAMILWEK